MVSCGQKCYGNDIGSTNTRPHQTGVGLKVYTITTKQPDTCVRPHRWNSSLCYQRFLHHLLYRSTSPSTMELNSIYRWEDSPGLGKLAILRTAAHQKLTTAFRACLLEVWHKTERPQSQTLMLWCSHRALRGLSPDFVCRWTSSYLQSVRLLN